MLLQRGEQRGLFAFSPPGGGPHPPQRPPHPGPMLGRGTHLGPAALGEERPVWADVGVGEAPAWGDSPGLAGWRASGVSGGSEAPGVAGSRLPG